MSSSTISLSADGCAQIPRITMWRLTNAENVEPLLIMLHCGMHREPGKEPQVPKHTGVCVECVSDCECGVDEYCGYDYKDTYDKDKGDWVFDFKVKVPAGITSSNKASHSAGWTTCGKKSNWMLCSLRASLSGIPARARTNNMNRTHTMSIAKPDR